MTLVIAGGNARALSQLIVYLPIVMNGIEETPFPTNSPPTTEPPPNCDTSYPTVCIPPPPPDLDCPNIPYRNFPVLPPDPYGFEGDKDGIGCETKT